MLASDSLLLPIRSKTAFFQISLRMDRTPPSTCSSTTYSSPNTVNISPQGTFLSSIDFIPVCLPFFFSGPVGVKSPVGSVSFPATIDLQISFIYAVPATANGTVVDQERSGVSGTPSPKDLISSDRAFNSPATPNQVVFQVWQHPVFYSRSVLNGHRLPSAE